MPLAGHLGHLDGQAVEAAGRRLRRLQWGSDRVLTLGLVSVREGRLRLFSGSTVLYSRLTASG